MARLVKQISDESAERLDALIAEGAFASRSDAVRVGLESVLYDERRRATVRAIAAGYRRRPQTEGDGMWTDSASAAMIAEEPWSRPPG